MSLFDSASLCITPNGVKEGKLYSIKPSDGSGDLIVTRATTATRVNSSGLVEVVPYNLFNYSQEFNNAAWNNTSGVTITANSAIAPNGTMTADRFVGTGGSWYFAQQKTLTSGITHTISVYVKSNTGSNQTFRLFGSTLLVSSNLTATTEWQRFEFSFTSTTALDHGIARDSSNNNADLLVWGAQLVEGSSAKEYLRTETRLNIPRLDYTNGSCPSILVEPQRTNLALSSEDFTNATYWNSTGDMVTTANQAISPSGLQNADLFFDSGSRNKFVSSPVSSYLTFSCYFKRVDVTNVLITASDFYSGDVSATFNLVALTSSSAISGDWSNNSTKIESVGNGWYRCSLTALRGAGGSGVQYRIECAEVEKSFYAWGYQLEAGSYATSYIPTTSASVTRNTDIIYKPGISSLIGQTEGTVFCDVYRKNSNSEFLLMVANSIGTNAYLNSIYFYQTSASVLIAEVFVSGTLQARITTSSGLSVGKHKIALGYKQNDFILYVDGVEIGTDTSGNIPTLSTLEINGADSGFTSSVGINSVVLWKEKLSNDTLATLTTL
jgi:hypothetical protein